MLSALAPAVSVAGRRLQPPGRDLEESAACEQRSRSARRGSDVADAPEADVTDAREAVVPRPEAVVPEEMRREGPQWTLPGAQGLGCDVADEDLACVVLPDQQLQGELDRERGTSDHELGEDLRVPEEDELRLRQDEAGLGRVAAVVDHGEDVEAERFDQSDRAPQDLVDAPVASQGDDAVVVFAGHEPTVRSRRCRSNPPAA